MRKISILTINHKFWWFNEFRWNNAFALKNHTFEKYHPWEIFVFQPLVTNFAYFWQNNSVLMKKVEHLKNISPEKVYISTVNCEFCRFLWKKFIFGQLVTNFAFLWWSNSLFFNIMHFKNIICKESSYFWNWSQILPIFGELIISFHLY